MSDSHYIAREKLRKGNYNKKNVCVVGIVDPTAQISIPPRYYQEFYIDCIYSTAVERHLEKGAPVALIYPELDNVRQTFPVERVAFFRALTIEEISSIS